jgi:flagellar hook-associated protein 2
VTVTVGAPAPSVDAVVSAVKSFVSSYNDVVDAIRSRTTENTVVNPQNSSDVIKGSLHGDTGLTSILSSLRGSLQTALKGNPTGLQMLSDLGISTGAVSATVNADSVAGKLTLDEDKLRGALASNPTAVKKLLGGATQTKGFAQAVGGVLAPLVQAGGVMDGRLKAVGSDLSDIKDALARFDDRMDQRRSLLEKQYTALELALSHNNSLATSVQQGLSRLM